MLVLSRKLNESIVIDGCITVKVVKVDGDVVKLGIQAPSSVAIHRQEVYEEILKNNQEALVRGNSAVPSIPQNLLKAKTNNKNTNQSAITSSPSAGAGAHGMVDGSTKDGRDGKGQKNQP
jgi:carbon storage regulator